jgi:murein peptide amidase A
MKNMPVVHSKFIVYVFIGIIALLSVDCSGLFRFKSSEKYSEAGTELYGRIQKSGIHWNVIAKSVKGNDIYSLEAGSGDSLTLIIGGFHGNEMQGTELVYRFAEYIANEYKGKINSRLVIIPVLNPDALIAGTRVNANQIDVNRNFPTENRINNERFGLKPASEPETKAIMEIVRKYKPNRIITVHTAMFVVNYDGPAEQLADTMAKYNGYPVSGSIGYPTPGSFGAYAGIEMKIPTITLELPPKQSFDKIWEQNREAFLAVIKY